MYALCIVSFIIILSTIHVLSHLAKQIKVYLNDLTAVKYCRNAGNRWNCVLIIDNNYNEVREISVDGLVIHKKSLNTGR